MNQTYILQWETDKIIVFTLRQVFYFVFVISLLIIHPFYTYVFQLNREKEKQTAVYPIMNHYHSVLKFIFVQGIIMTIYHFTYNVVDLGDSDEDDYENQKLNIWSAIKEGLLMFYYWFNQYFLYLFTRVQCLLISIVSLQRFLLYFIPGTEPFVNIEQKTMSGVIKILYVLTGIVVLCFLALDHFELVPTLEKTKTLKSLSPFGFHYPLSFYMFYGLHHAIDSILEFLVEIDFLNTPLIVQTSYLFCNKRNVETLFLKNLLKPRDGARIMPLEVIYSTNGVIG